MLEAIISYKLSIILIFLGVILFVEARSKFVETLQKEKIRWQRHIALFCITGLISALVVLPITYFAVEISDWRRHVAFLDHWGVMLVDLLILDLWIYAWHRANHQFDFLWRFHEIHHLDHKMDATTSLRFHFGEVLLSAIFRAIVMIILDIPILHIILFEILVMCSAIFHHSAIILPPKVEKCLYPLWVTPAYHLVHHHAKDQDLHSHYATMIPIWDRLFGTYQGYKKLENARMGVPDQTGHRLPDLPVLKLIMRPFQRKKG